MSKEELITKAKAGDVDAMLQLISVLVNEEKFTDAMYWADKAAETGNMNAMYKAAHLHSLAMYAFKEKKIWGVMSTEAQAAQKNAALLVGAHRRGSINLNDDVYSQMLSILRDGLYYEAAFCYMSEPSDYNRVIHLLKDLDTTRERFLCGYACFMVKQYDDAIEKLYAAYRDQAYLTSHKELIEETIFVDAMRTLSAIERATNGNFEKAMQILNQAINGVSDEEGKAFLRKELARYQKKLFGGWKYV